MNIGEHVPTISAGFPSAVLWNRAAKILNIVRKFNLGPNMVGQMNNAGISLDSKAVESLEPLPAAPYDIVLTPQDVEETPEGEPPVAPDTDVTIIECVSWKAGVTKKGDDMTITIGPGEKEAIMYISEQYDDNTGEFEILAGATLEEVVFTEEIEPTETRVRRLLYRLESDGGAWRVIFDYRKQLLREIHG